MHAHAAYIFSGELDAGGVMLWDLCIWQFGHSSRGPLGAEHKHKDCLLQRSKSTEHLSRWSTKGDYWQREGLSYLWEVDSLNEESAAACRPMTRDLRLWRRSSSSLFPSKDAKSGVLLATGEAPLCFRDGEAHWRTRERGEDDELIVTACGERGTQMHIKFFIPLCFLKLHLFKWVILSVANSNVSCWIFDHRSIAIQRYQRKGGLIFFKAILN